MGFRASYGAGARDRSSFQPRETECIHLVTNSDEQQRRKPVAQSRSLAASPSGALIVCANRGSYKEKPCVTLVTQGIQKHRSENGSFVRLSFGPDLQRLDEFERERGFRGKRDFPISGESCAARSRSRAD